MGKLFMDGITKQVLVKALPSHIKKTLSDELVAHINHTLQDVDHYETFRENFLSYLNVLEDGKFKINDYMNAVKYTSFKLMGCTNQDAYIKTFPKRYEAMLVRGLSAKEISSIICSYNKNKLVNRIMAQSLVPSWVLNQDLYQKAINVQADLMVNAQSEKVRSDAANSLLIHLKPPETKKVELDIGLKQDKEVEEMKRVLLELSAKQQQMLKAGVVDTRQIAQTKIITVDYEQKDG